MICPFGQETMISLDNQSSCCAPRHSKVGDAVLVEFKGNLHFGVITFISRLCIWTSAPLKHGTILGVKIDILPDHQRIYTYEPFEE